MWRRILVAATVCLTSVVAAPAPALAAAPVPGPAQVGLDQSCDQVLRQALRTARATAQSDTVTCLSRTSSPTVRPMEEGLCGNNSWDYGRHSACTTEYGYVLNVFAIVEGVPRLAGQIFHAVSTRLVTSGHSLQWEHSFNVQIDYAWGAVTGITVNANAECSASNCSNHGFYFNFGAATPGFTRGGRSIFHTTSLGFESYWHTSSTWRWWFMGPGSIPSNSLTISPPPHRCDEAVGIVGSVGCVFTQRVPVHEIGSTRYPKYARHIQLAINFGLPSVLTRTRDSAQMAANRARACPQSPTNGWTCDEYPFASTHEGAANPMHPYGRTFQILNWNSGYPPFICGIGWVTPRQMGDSRGYSVCGIPSTDNIGGGVDLGVFYADSRVLHNDRFSVRVV